MNQTVLLLGDGAVGKTTLLSHFGTLLDKHQLVHKAKYICQNGSEMMFYDQLDEQATQIDVFIIIYSVISPDSFRNANNVWFQQAQQLNPNARIVLIGNKTDLRENPAIVSRLEERNQSPITQKNGEELAKVIGAEFLETSFFATPDQAIDFIVNPIPSTKRRKRRTNKKVKTCCIQ